ncbi:hypothetical protein B5807_08001 [Epicoccum nigrum]|uniref:Zn(2)-C6 fungal-type domain-containing protein n=1 Tax=Epicoccum nigrum TaxID=105696 RepID=A0A1Y2LQZ6_EPING|nr:hypothetical protein B5807_08001 [Epicoccum nigrum]
MASSDGRAPTTTVNTYGASSSASQALGNVVGNEDHDSAALWPQMPVQLARGRQPRDALAKIVSYTVASMDDFETALREYLNAPSDQPEHTEAQLSFWIGTSFMVLAPNVSQSQQQQQQQPPPPHLAPQNQQNQQVPPGFQPPNGFPTPYGAPSHAYQSIPDPAVALTLQPSFQQHHQHHQQQQPPAVSNGSHSTTAGKKPQHKVSLSIMEALQPTTDPKDKMRKQRAIAKCCVDAIQRIDGYRYSFHNCWNSREDDSFRFSYYCNDSLLNKDRAANGKGAKLGKRATKPVYDCKGVLSIKFSATKETLDVFYKHVPVHKTYEERAPPPRKDSKRRKYLEENDPETLAKIMNRPKEDSAEPTPRPPKKKKPLKPEPPRPSNTSLESDLRAQSLQSLLLLIRNDSSLPPDPPPPEPEPVQQPTAVLPPPFQAPRNQLPQQQQQQQPLQQPLQPQRKRLRVSCDVCKIKKTRCDGVRPFCQTCVDKKRDCYYSDPAPGDDQRSSTALGEPVQQAPASASGLSELEKMKKELEEARARIQQLEQEQRASTTPVQAPQPTAHPQSQQQQQPQQPQSQPQAQSLPHTQNQQRHSMPQAQLQAHVQQSQQQQQQRQQVSQNHRQQLQQLNQVAQRRNSPQQIAYSLDNQSTQPQQQQQQQRLQSPRQLSQTAQQLPLHAQQSFFTAVNQSPYNALNRTVTQGSISSQSTQNALSAQNSISSSAGLGQAQPRGLMHNSGNLPGGGSVDASGLYGSVGRSDLNWPPAAYYGFQSTQPQQSQDQWGNARDTNVFR